MYVWWDGVANPCEVDFKSSLSVGHISKNDVRFMDSSIYENLRKNIKKIKIQPRSMQ